MRNTRKTATERLAIFFKRRVKGVTAKEVSVKTGIPLRTVQNNLARVPAGGWLGGIEMDYVPSNRKCTVSGTLAGTYARVVYPVALAA